MYTDDTETSQPNTLDTGRVPRVLVVTQWIWVVSMALSLIGVLCAVLVEPGVLEWILFSIAVAQAGIVLPAAVAVVRGRRWAHRVLTVMACLCIAPSWQALQHHAWPAAVLNIVLVATLGLLQHPTAMTYCGRRKSR